VSEDRGSASRPTNEASAKSRSLAILLTLVAPGLGHLYLRRWGRGVVILAASAVLAEWALADLPLEAILAGGPPPPLGRAIGLLALLLAVVAVSLWDVGRLTAER
jgi:hypothetical protein